MQIRATCITKQFNIYKNKTIHLDLTHFVNAERGHDNLQLRISQHFCGRQSGPHSREKRNATMY